MRNAGRIHAFSLLIPLGVIPARAEITTSKTVHVKKHWRITKHLRIEHEGAYYKTTKTTRVSGYTRTDKNGHIVHVQGYNRHTTIISKHKSNF